MSRAVKVGFLVSEKAVSPYVRDLIAHVAASPAFAQPVLVHAPPPAPAGQNLLKRQWGNLRREGPLRYVRTLLFKTILKTIRRLERSKAQAILAAFDTTYPIETLPKTRILPVDATWSASGLFQRFEGAALREIENERFDVLIRCGAGILKGDVLDASRLGVLSFHHGDNRVNRGGPAGFWEVLNREPGSGFIIQRLNEELDGGDVLVRGRLMTKTTWTSNNTMLQAKSNAFMIRLLDQIAQTGHLPPAEGMILHDRPLYKLDRNPVLLLRYIGKTLVPAMWRRLVTVVLRAPRRAIWSVAFAPYDGHSASLWRYKEIENPPGRFLGDPFVHTQNGQTVLFVEDYSLKTERGRISAIDLTGGTPRPLGPVIEHPYHMSFPYLFNVDGRLFMVPETHEAGEIQMYECTGFPMSWRLHKVLMRNVSAADTMILEHDGRWYMFTNICSAGVNEHHSELHIFHADRPDSEDWTPIAQGNPVIFDALNARNGGLIHHRGALYRINQIQGAGLYGRAFGINQITRLDPQGYTEVRVDTVEPNFKPNLVGTHHFFSDGHYSVIDFARYRRPRG